MYKDYVYTVPFKTHACPLRTQIVTVKTEISKFR